MRWITVGLVIVAPFAEAQGPPWVPLSVGLPAVAVDTSSTVRLGPTMTLARFRIQYAAPMPTPTSRHLPPHLEVEMLAEVQCTDSSFRTLTMRFFDGAGREIARVREASPWMKHQSPATGYLMASGWCKLRPKAP